MSYFRGKYYTYADKKEFYMFGLGFVPNKWVDAFVVKRYDEMTEKEINKVRKKGCPCCGQSMEKDSQISGNAEREVNENII